MKVKAGVVGRHRDIDQAPGGAGFGARGAEFHEQFLAVDLHFGDLFEARPQPFELAPAHGAFLVDAPLALRQHVKLVVLRQQLDVDAVAHRLPGQADERLLQFGQPAFRGADQIADRRIGGAHLGQHFFGWNAAVHHPNALGFAVLGFDFIEHVTQRGFVGGVAGQHLVAERKAMRRHDQRDHHLHAVAAFVAAVAVAVLVRFIVRRRRLE